MSLYERVQNEISGIVIKMQERGARLFDPAQIAGAVDKHIDADRSAPELTRYTSIEQIKLFTRKFLAHEFDPIKRDYEDIQEDMFSDLLQDHYPATRQIDGETRKVYVLRDDLTDTDYRANCRRMERDITGRQAHLDAFKAWWKSAKSPVKAVAGG